MEDLLFKIDFLFKMYNIIEIYIIERKNVDVLKRKYIKLIQKSSNPKAIEYFNSYKYILDKCINSSKIINYNDYSDNTILLNNYKFIDYLINEINEHIYSFFKLKYTNKDKNKLNHSLINWIKFTRNHSMVVNFKNKIKKLNILSDHYLDYEKDIEKIYEIYDYDNHFYEFLNFHCTTNEITKLKNVIGLIECGTSIKEISDDLILKLFTFKYDFVNKKVIFDAKKVFSQEEKIVKIFFCSLNKQQKDIVIKHFMAIHNYINSFLESKENIDPLFPLYILTFIEYFKIIIGDFDDELTIKVKSYLK